MNIRLALTATLLALGGTALFRANRLENPLPEQARADLIVVEKSKRLLTLYSHGHRLKSYRVSLGREPIGAKRREGDKRTPEGDYVIDHRKAESAYFPYKPARD